MTNTKDNQMNATETNTDAAATKFLDSIGRKMVNLAGRWADEHEYENIADYAEALKADADAAGATITGMQKRPFGVKFSADGKDWLITASASGKVSMFELPPPRKTFLEAEIDNFKKLYMAYGFQKDDLGRSFVQGQDCFMLVGLSPRKHTRPIIARRASDAKLFAFPREVAALIKRS